MKKGKKLILFLAVLILAINFVSAATYYMATNGNDANPGTSAQPWRTFVHAFATMQGGDILIIRNGTYAQQLTDMPSGTAQAYTIIRAENNWGVIIDGSSFGVYTSPLAIGNKNYVLIGGIKFNGALRNMPGSVYASDHIKIIRCAFYGAKDNDNEMVFDITDSSYILVEECWAWGTGRYKFIAYQSSNIIFRRCVARHDYHSGDWASQCATFTVYDTKDFLIENCIGINSGHNPSLYGTLYGGVWSENNANIQNDGKILGSIFLDLGGLGINDPKNNRNTREIKDVVVWDTIGGYNGGVTGGLPNLSIEHFTTGYGEGDGYDGAGSGINIGDTTFRPARIFNSIIESSAVGVFNYYTSDIDLDYNDYFNNTINFRAGYNQIPPSPGTHDRYINPNLKYITRIESDSPLKGAASDGGDIGANIIYRYGVSGTLWGEVGYDQLTNEPLWPFPNEARIKQDMASYSGTGPSGKRGFAADGNGLYGGPITLTSYIWEYLGNPCPADICNYNIQYHPADTNQNNIIEMRELIAFIGLWKASQANINDVLEALNRWFRGS